MTRKPQRLRNLVGTQQQSLHDYLPFWPAGDSAPSRRPGGCSYEATPTSNPSLCARTCGISLGAARVACLQVLKDLGCCLAVGWSCRYRSKTVGLASSRSRRPTRAINPPLVTEPLSCRAAPAAAAGTRSGSSCCRARRPPHPRKLLAVNHGRQPLLGGAFGVPFIDRD